MKKLLLLCLAFVASVAAKAEGVVLPETAKAILTLKAEVGTEVSIKPGVYAAYDIFGVDFGDGTVVVDSVGHQNKGVCVDDGSDVFPQKDGTTHTGITEFKGTVAGEGTITVYGTSDIWYLALTSVMPTTMNQEKLKKVVQFTISKMGVDALDLTGLDDLEIFGFSQGSVKSLNVSANAKLRQLTVNNNSASAFESVLESLDLSANANLEQLNVMGASASKPGKLTALNLSNNTKLTNVYAQYNALTSLVLPEGAELSFLNVQNNELESVDLSKVGSLKDTYLNNNKLTTVDLSKLKEGANLYLDGNQLTEVSVPVSVKNLQLNNNKLTKVSIVGATASCKLENNCLTLATLPAQPEGMNTSDKTKKFTYAPQAALAIPETATVIDLSSQLTLEKGELNPADYTAWLSGTTTFSIVTKGGTTLVEGTDYAVIAPGKFRFLKEQSEKVYVVMLNEALPKFTASVPFATTEFEVATTPILTLNAPVGNEVSLTFGVHGTEDSYGVDFGDGTVQVAKVGLDNKGPVQADGSTSSATKFTGTVAGDGTIKVYGSSDVWYYNTSGGVLPTAFDQPKLMNVVQMSITGADIEKVVLPSYEKMTQFSFNNSSVKSVDVSKVPSMTSLTINNTTASKFEPQLEGIDVSKNPELTYLSLQGNANSAGKLTSVDLTNNTKLENVYLQYNELTEVKLADGYEKLGIFNAQNNKLTAFDATKTQAMKSLYLADNQLSTIDVSKCEKLAWLDVKNNKLTGDLDLTANTKFTNVYVNGNQLTSVKVTDVTKQFYFDNNKMTFATMPTKPASLNTASKVKQYHYAPQAALEVAESLFELDLSDQLTATGILEAPATTTFSFATVGGTALVEGTDYTVTEPGKFKFVKTQTEKVYGVLANEAFPLFTGDNAFKTTEFNVVADVELTIADGYNAYSNASTLDFSATGIKVYTAKRTDNYVVLTEVESGLVPAGAGVILAGDAKTYTVPVAAEAAALPNNELVGVTEQTTVNYAESGNFNYILQGGVFKKATGAKLNAGKAYLSTAFDVAATSDSRLIIVIGNETTGITTVGAQQSADNLYDLQGRQVQKPAKGVYIVNGKKVIVK